jgi:hypothetical protein
MPFSTYHASRQYGGACMNQYDEPVGRAKGGFARAEILPPEQRTAIARRAAETRWSIELRDDIPTTISGSPDRPLRIGNIEIPCYVLDDKRRVLVQRGLQTGIGMSTSGGSDGAQRLAVFIEKLAKKGVDCRDLAVRIREPILFRSAGGGRPAYG